MFICRPYSPVIRYSMSLFVVDARWEEGDFPLCTYMSIWSSWSGFRWHDKHKIHQRPLRCGMANDCVAMKKSMAFQHVDKLAYPYFRWLIKWIRKVILKILANMSCINYVAKNCWKTMNLRPFNKQWFMGNRIWPNVDQIEWSPQYMKEMRIILMVAYLLSDQWVVVSSIRNVHVGCRVTLLYYTHVPRTEATSRIVPRNETRKIGISLACTKRSIKSIIEHKS